MLQNILAQFVSGFELVQTVLKWAIENEVAATFWAAFWVVILDRFFAWTPNTWDDTAWNILKQAVRDALSKIKPTGR
jgi:hypothetical protein